MSNRIRRRWRSTEDGVTHEPDEQLPFTVDRTSAIGIKAIVANHRRDEVLESIRDLRVVGVGSLKTGPRGAFHAESGVLSLELEGVSLKPQICGGSSFPRFWKTAEPHLVPIRIVGQSYIELLVPDPEPSQQ